MTDSQLYLKEDVYFEPLFNHWYAWCYLLPPVTAARYMVNTHRRIMMSFVNNYELHISAMKESVVTGGDFLNCSEDQVEEIQALIDEINIKHADLVELSKSVQELDELLAQHTSGQSIEVLYEKIPERLRGFVELNLDLQHRPGFRLIEPLLYKSQYYLPALQSLSFGTLSKVEERPFVLTTPRLPDDKHIQIKQDFNSHFVDTIFRAREIPLSLSQVDEIFASVEKIGGLDYRDLFTEKKSSYPYEKINEGVRVQYTGHAGFMLETKSVTILIDPVIASRAEKYAGDLLSYSEIPPVIDYICLTHNHQDHLNIETLLQLRYKTRMILVPKSNGGSLADPSIKLLLKNLQFNVVEFDELEEIQIPDGKITSIPFLGEHGDLNIRSKTAWLIELQGKKSFFGADSANPDINIYRHMQDLFTHIDIFAIGMECVGAPFTWLYGALHTKMVPKVIKESRRLNGCDSTQAFALVEMFKPKIVFIYALGLEPWYKYFMGLEYDDNSRQIVESKKMIASCKNIDIPVETMNGRRAIML